MRDAGELLHPVVVQTSVNIATGLLLLLLLLIMMTMTSLLLILGIFCSAELALGQSLYSTFYRYDYVSARHAILACRAYATSMMSVRPSVCLSVGNVGILRSRSLHVVQQKVEISRHMIGTWPYLRHVADP